jgi:fibro-slime domain-containing protein
MIAGMKGSEMGIAWLRTACLLGLAAAAAFGQATAPAALVLKGKVRDFIEDNAKLSPSHPHFLGTRPQPDCSAQQFGVDIAADAIDTTDDPGDTAVFPGDNRGPRLLASLDPNVAPCFDPPARFTDWYNDRTAGDVNRAFLIDIPFTRDSATGVYEYADDDFFPIDSGKAFRKLGAEDPYGYLLPSPNDRHDFGFTMEFHANFTYFKGKDQVFNFRGDDDVWVFVNGKKAIELGGIHPAQNASFNLDSIAASHGLKDSLVYPLDFFFAERHVTTSRLRITTSLELQPVTSKPALPPGRHFEGSLEVAVSHPAADAVFYYTTDGSVPTVNSARYTGPIALDATATVTVIAVRPGYRPSDPVSETYTRMETVATPEADPKGTTFTAPIRVALSDATPGAVIHYTVDGTEPDSTSPAYAGPIAIAASTTVKARAYLADWVPSAVMTEIYTDAETLPPPVAVPGQGGFVTAVTVDLSEPGYPEAQIRYTLDGSDPTEASPLYTDPIPLAATATLKARAYQAGLHPSLILTQVYRRLPETVKAVYVDFDGDGRVDGAVIHLDIAAAAIPSAIRLTDPFSQASLVVLPGQVTRSADGLTLIARFPAQPFAAGTAFTTADLGSFPGVADFSNEPFAISDSAGPVPLKAVSHNKATPEDEPSLDVTFSEPIDPAFLQAGPAWPFAIIRGGGTESRPVRVVKIEPVAGQAATYRFTFAATSPAYPVYTDSLELAPAPPVRDAHGAAGVAGGKRIPVEGGPLNVANTFEIKVTNPIVPQSAESVQPSAAVRARPFAVIGGTEFNQNVCLDCGPGTDTEFLGGEVPPEWVIRSKYPFHYAFSIFDHLGNFVNRIQGEVSAEMMAKVAQDPDGLRTLRFRWKPIADNGRAVGTGAYILKGLVQNLAGEAQQGSQGESQVVQAAQKTVLATFGYLRQRL